MKTEIQIIIDQIRIRLPNHSEIMANGELYQVCEIYDHLQWEKRTRYLEQFDWNFHIGEFVFAEDIGGNYFTIDSDGMIFFLDHETDERTLLCQTLKEFSERLQEPESIELPQHKVVRVWVDPDFKPKFK